MRSKDVMETFKASAQGIAEAVESGDNVSKQKVIAGGVIGGLEYLAKKTDNEIDDKIISLVKSALPFAL